VGKKEEAAAAEVERSIDIDVQTIGKYK